MKRENRYLVLKLADIDRYLNLSEHLGLLTLRDNVSDGRYADGRPPLECVVVESDWPEYEPTWAAIDARVDAEATAEVDNKHYCNDGYWWEMIRPSAGGRAIRIGRGCRVYESEFFLNETAAYKQKNKWLTKYKMFCTE